MKHIIALCLVAGLLSACNAEPGHDTGTSPKPLETVQNTVTAPSTVPTVPSEPVQTMPVGWHQSAEGRRYYFSDGSFAVGWSVLDGKRYYFNQDGFPQTGWFRVYEKRYYANADAEIQTGWFTADGNRYCADADGALKTGWQKQDGNWYFLNGEGILQIGWLKLDAGHYYMNGDGVMQTGWLTLDGKRYYLNADGILQTGWLEVDGKHYFATDSGELQTGFAELDGKRYYMDAKGVMQTGWQEIGGKPYYLRQDGSMARGKVIIDGKTFYFTSTGAQIVLVNPWNFKPEDYTVELKSVGNGHRVDERCYDALMQMLADCKKAGFNAQVASSYRTQADQEYLYARKVRYYKNLGYGDAEAKRLAGTVVALPGTSEHQLGLAVDLVDNNNWNLDESQEKMPAQKWLMENSWKYGFILRYPSGKSEHTGIIYEPWHYRYVGTELAAELHDCGLCLEEYLAGLS